LKNRSDGGACARRLFATLPSARNTIGRRARRPAFRSRRIHAISRPGAFPAPGQTHEGRPESGCTRIHRCDSANEHSSLASNLTNGVVTNMQDAARACGQEVGAASGRFLRGIACRPSGVLGFTRIAERSDAGNAGRPGAGAEAAPGRVPHLLCSRLSGACPCSVGRSACERPTWPIRRRIASPGA